MDLLHPAPFAHGPRVHADGTTTFAVWAPRAEVVDLELDGVPERMVAREGGWFTARVEAGHGDDYAFRLDGREERPDPASRWQPDGVHERSRVFDPGTIGWSPDERHWRATPLSSAVVYELHVGTFTSEGTFAAAAERLGHLADLGVTHVEVMPVNGFSGDRGWGYDGVAWYAVHEPYGGPAGFGAFVDACHRHGLAVVLDVIYNHLGPSGNYLPEFGPYQTDHYATPWGPAVNLDGPGSDPVRQYIVGNAVQWLRDYHVDALRLDAVHALIDISSTHILAELSDAVAALAAELGRPLQLIAETDRNDPLTVTPRDLGGLGMDGQWCDDLHHGIHTAVTGERDGYYVDYAGLPDVAAAYTGGYVYDGRYSTYRERSVGAPYHHRPAWRLVACIQNHDQVGNRAFGDRLDALVDPALARIAVVLLAAAPHTPMLFMGDEYGETNPFLFFSGHTEPALAAAIRDGRREEFAAFATFRDEEVPDPQDPATRDRSRMDWSQLDHAQGQQRLALWRDLIRLRRDLPALGNGRLDHVQVLDCDAAALVVARTDPYGAPVLLTANLADAPREFAVLGDWAPLVDTGATGYGGAGRTAHRGDEGVLVQPPRTATLWTLPE
jgi:maltooligosyltrehalose trehalohydrolase